MSTHAHLHCQEKLHSPVVTGTPEGTSEVDRLRCLWEPVGKYHTFTVSLLSTYCVPRNWIRQTSALEAWDIPAGGIRVQKLPRPPAMRGSPEKLARQYSEWGWVELFLLPM